MIINLELDSAAQAAPAAVKAIWQEAANIIGSMFTDNITVNLSVDWSGTGGGASAGPAGGEYESYSSVYNYLKGSASPGDSSFDYLPTPGSANAPSQVAVWNAQLKAMGLMSPTGSEVDGDVFFDTDISQSSLLGVALHEFTHALGRVPFSDGSGDPDIMELDRFSSVGNRLANDSIPAPTSYFSLNGGSSSWAEYGQGSDPSDFLNSQNYSGYGSSPLAKEDPFDEYYDGGTLQYMTPADLELMDTLGFHLKEDAPAEDAYDFNGSNSGDILIQNSAGQIEYANMAGGSFQGFVTVVSTPGWAVVGEGKISGNVDSDIVLQSGGQMVYADLVNGTLSNFVYVGNVPGYNVVGVGDINDDHFADIVIQSSGGQILYANMDNGIFNGWVNVISTPGYAVKAVADINDTGYDDIVIQNSAGQILYANMDNGVFDNWVNVGSAPGYNVVGAGDIARDGYADIVVQDSSNGLIEYANMDNGVFNGWVSVADAPGWNVIGVEDILGNGFDDIVIQNPISGQIVYANMTAGVFNGWVAIGSTPGYTGSDSPASTSDGSAGSSGSGSEQVASNSPDTAGTSSSGGDGDNGQYSGNSTTPLPGQSVPVPAFNVEPAPNLGSPSGNGNALSGVMVQDPEGANPGSPSGVGNLLSGVLVQDPEGANPGSPSGDSNVLSGMFMQNPAPPNGIGGAADYLNGQNGSPGAALPTSASWLTEGAQSGSPPTNGAAQVPGNSGPGSNPASIVTADNLQNLLHSGS